MRSAETDIEPRRQTAFLEVVGRLDHGFRTIFDLDAVLKIIGSMRLRGYHRRQP
jgi:hypothetical protein